MTSELIDEGNDELLVGRIVARDSTALETVYRRYGSLMYSAARRITGDPGVAEEVLQDTFFQLWQKASLFDTDRGSLIGWLLTITRNKALSRLRQKPDHERIENETMLPYNTDVSRLEREIAHQLIIAALGGLPFDQCQAITLAYFDGLTCTEIAARTKSPEGTVKSRLRSGLKRMRRDLSREKSAKTGRARNRVVELHDIVITNQLLTRICRERSPSTEKECLHALSEVAKTTPQELIKCFLQMGLELCEAGSAGLSFLEAAFPKQVFRWTHLAGKLEKYVGESTPRNFSPCGVTLDRDSPQLFRYPSRYFTYFNKVDIPIVEGLVIPFHGGEANTGTVWIASHKESSTFDSEDARIMGTLTQFIQVTLPLVTPLDSSQNGV